MAYLLTVSGKVKKYNKEKLNQLNETLKGKIDPKTIHPDLIIEDFENGKFTIDINGNIDLELDEYIKDFYEKEKIAEILSEIIEDGYIIMEFIDIEEDYGKFGYLITPNHIIELSYMKIPKHLKEKVERIIKSYIEIEELND